MNKKNICLFGILALNTINAFQAGAQQQKGFDIKKHGSKSTAASHLQPVVIDGRNHVKSSIWNSPYASITQNLSTITSTGAKNSRVGSSEKITILKETGLPIFISSSTAGSNNRVSDVSPELSCFNYLKKIGNILKISDPEKNFFIEKVEKGEQGKTHVTLLQKHKNFPVYGASVKVHLSPNGQGEAFNGRYYLVNDDFLTEFKTTVEQALAVAKIAIHKKGGEKKFNASEKILVESDVPQVDTLIYPSQGLILSYNLSYHITLFPNILEKWEYFIDAQTGKILHSFMTSCHVDGPAATTASDLNGVTRPVNSYLEGNEYILMDASKPMYDAATQAGALVTLNANNTFGEAFKVEGISNTTNQWNDPIAVSAHYNAGIAYDYFRLIHGRNSIDGNGGNIISVINAVDEDGSALDNAFWNGKAIFYGNGNVGFKPLAGGLDVAGHEMSHGVVQNTANLRYEGESGAINESMADVFGCMMDSSNWTIGEEIVNPAFFTSGAMRSMSDPHNGGSGLDHRGYQPNHMNEKYRGKEDNGGVHINSGIPNHAFYLYASKIGKLKASKIYYKALTTYLTQSSQFIDLRLAIIAAATEMHGENSSEAKEAGLAFDAVGIYANQGTDETSDLETNPGREFMLIFNADESADIGLEKFDPASKGFESLTNKTIKNKPSVTDDGSTVVFVGVDKKLYTLNLNEENALPLLVQEDPIWSSVSISKDGKRVAAVPEGNDSSIYVFDRTSNNYYQFLLYNPTFTPGVNAPGPLYADAIEWDHSGEYLVYDAFNSIINSDGDNIEYWDINLIKVWDNTLNGFGDGNIFKLITNLEEGESVGNPSFSKNSPYIIAFDYFNESKNEYAIIGYDLEHNDMNGIVMNNTIGWPCYNRNDSLIAYTAVDETEENFIATIPLSPNKITYAEGQEARFYIELAKWGIFYANGKRNLEVGVEKRSETEVLQMNAFPNPAKEEITVSLQEEVSGNATLFRIDIINALGVPMIHMEGKDFSEKKNIVNIATLPPGIYTLKISSDESLGMTKFIKE